MLFQNREINLLQKFSCDKELISWTIILWTYPLSFSTYRGVSYDFARLKVTFSSLRLHFSVLQDFT